MPLKGRGGNHPHIADERALPGRRTLPERGRVPIFSQPTSSAQGGDRGSDPTEPSAGEGYPHRACLAEGATVALDWTEERREWARGRLQRLKEACEAYDADQKARRYEGVNRELYAAMIREEPTTKRILDALDPQLDQLNVQSYPAGHLTAISTVEAARGMLDDRRCSRRRCPAAAVRPGTPRSYPGTPGSGGSQRWT
jgi:hypothetical protein